MRTPTRKDRDPQFPQTELPQAKLIVNEALTAEAIDEREHEREQNLPMVAIVGRPNVGKSTLFNRIIGRRRAVVHDKPGVTRDRLIDRAEWDGLPFLLVDTGGFDVELDDPLLASVVEQAKLAIDEADAIIF